jgi:hypothetical protein
MEIAIAWQCPEEGWFSLNTDGLVEVTCQLVVVDYLEIQMVNGLVVF